MAHLKSEILGHEHVLQQLLNLGQTQRLPSCLIFSGPLGIGKRKVAKALAQAALCENSTSTNWQACGHCGSCHRIYNDQSESIKEIKPQQNQIRIDEARELIQFFELQKIGRARFAIIDDAELLNIQASNSLLKCLEEPPADTYIIMITASPWKLLSTIQSRSVRIDFQPLSISDLRKINQEAPDWMLQAAYGQVARIKEMMEWDQKNIRQHSLYLISLILSKSDWTADEQFRKIITDKNHSLAITRHLLSLWRDLCLLSTDKFSDQIINRDQKEQLLQLANLKTLDFFLQRFKLCLNLETGLKMNQDSQLAFEQFSLEMQNAD